MDEGTQIKEVVTLWDAALWLIALLWGGVTVLTARIWKGHERRVSALEELCASEHRQRQHDLNQHAVADAGAHDRIREKLAAELATLHEKIDTKTDALSQQITTQHSALSAQIFDLAKMIGGKK